MTMTLRKSILASAPWRIALGIVAIALPATADAPRNPPQYAQFDQDSLEIVDQFTNLVWDRRRVQKNTHDGGQSYCSDTVFPGSGRLPTVKELLTIVDEEPHEEYDTTFTSPIVLKSIDQQAFPNTATREPYWTSTPAPGGKFWTVEFTTGTTEARAATESLNTRCVR
jgi:Protein of unknown function (DUF1566)